MKRHRAWVLATCGAGGLLLGAVALFNLLVDPLGIYRLVVRDGVNANKTFAIKHTRLVKPYVVEQMAARSIALGTSRIEVGIDPDHPAWPADWRPVYNYGLEGTSIKELTEHLEYALSVAPVRRMMFGLDFLMFIAKEEREERWEGKVRLHLQALLSLDALRASRKTLQKQDAEDDPGLLQNGQVAWTANLRRVRKYGHRRDFLNTERSFLRKFGARGTENPLVTAESLVALQRAMELCRQHGVEVAFVIPPVHVRMQEVYYQNGRYRDFLDWKVTLARLIADNNLAHADLPPFALYDFATVNPVTTEPVPAEGDHTLMQYFWETSHCRKEAGDLMIARLFDASVTSLPESFGRRLTADNALQATAADGAMFLSYRAEHPEMVEEIASLKAPQ